MKNLLLIIFCLSSIGTLFGQDAYLMSYDGKFVRKTALGFYVADANTIEESTRFNLARTSSTSFNVFNGTEFLSIASTEACEACVLILGGKKISTRLSLEINGNLSASQPFKKGRLKSLATNKYVSPNNFNGKIMGVQSSIPRALSALLVAPNQGSIFTVIDARVVDLAKRMGVQFSLEDSEFVMQNGVLGIKNRIEIKPAEFVAFFNEYIKETEFELYNKEGHSKLRCRFGPPKIPFINKDNPFIYSGMPNIYIEGGMPGGLTGIKIMPYRLKSKTNGVQAIWDNRTGLEMVVYFESEDVEFIAEGKKSGSGWHDYAVPDLHWDHANIRVKIGFKDNGNKLLLRYMKCKSVHGKWGLRGVNGLSPDILDDYLNKKISEGLEDAMDKSENFEKFNEFVNVTLLNKVKQKVGGGFDVKLGHIEGQFFATVFIPIIL